MFPERSEGDAQAGSPPEETQLDAAQTSEDAVGAAESAEAVTVAAEDSSDAVIQTDDESPSAEAEVESDAVPADEADTEPSEQDDSSGPDDDVEASAAATDADDGADQIDAVALASDEEATEASGNHSDDPHHWDGPSVPFVPHHALLEGMMALAFLTFGLIFVAMIPAPLEARANPYLSPEGVLPEWYLMAPFELLHLVPPLPGMLGVGAAVGVLMLWPFIDRHPRRITRRPFMMALSFLILASILALSIIPYVHTGE